MRSLRQLGAAWMYGFPRVEWPSFWSFKSLSGLLLVGCCMPSLFLVPGAVVCSQQSPAPRVGWQTHRDVPAQVVVPVVELEEFIKCAHQCSSISMNYHHQSVPIHFVFVFFYLGQFFASERAMFFWPLFQDVGAAQLRNFEPLGIRWAPRTVSSEVSAM